MQYICSQPSRSLKNSLIETCDKLGKQLMNNGGSSTTAECLPVRLNEFKNYLPQLTSSKNNNNKKKHLTEVAE